MEKKILVVGGATSYYKPFERFGEYTSDLKVLIGTQEEVLNRVGLVVFTGGEDVSPILYNEPTRIGTHCDINRDKEEVFAFSIASRLKLPLAGICRGSQFLCVMAGGKLVQHLNNHGGNHNITLWDKRVVNVSSTHHQMQIPPAGAKILGWCEKKSNTYLNGYNEEINIDIDIDIVHYPMINAIGMQYHPEYMKENSEGFKLASEVVENFLFEK